MDAPYKGESVEADLKQVLTDLKPTKVFVSHPADTNPDHESYYLFLRTALWDLKDEVQAEIYPYLTHYGEWPQPRGLLMDVPHEPPAKFDEPGRWVTLPLEPAQVQKKLDAIKRHKTQYQASGPYLESYIRANELCDTVKDIPLNASSPSAIILPSGTGVAGDAVPPDAYSDGAARKVRLAGDERVFAFELGAGLQGWRKGADLRDGLPRGPAICGDAQALSRHEGIGLQDLRAAAAYAG